MPHIGWTAPKPNGSTATRCEQALLTRLTAVKVCTTIFLPAGNMKTISPLGASVWSPASLVMALLVDSRVPKFRIVERGVQKRETHIPINTRDLSGSSGATEVRERWDMTEVRKTVAVPLDACSDQGGRCAIGARGNDRHAPMSVTHMALAVLVVALWGTNFVIIRVGLSSFPPFAFAMLRFVFASLPFLLFIPRPQMRLAPLVGYGLLVGIGNFGVMLYAMAGHIAPGLASLLVQTQAFFTIALAALVDGERIRAKHVIALLLCVAGVAIIARHIGGDADLTGVVLALLAGLAWAGGNMIARHAGGTDLIPMLVWSNLVSAIGLLPIALWMEGLPAIVGSLVQLSPAAWVVLAWQSLGNALGAYAIWNWLLSRHRAADVAPMGLLIPIFGMSASAWFLSEPMPIWKMIAAALVLAGLIVNLWRSDDRPVILDEVPKPL